LAKEATPLKVIVPAESKRVYTRILLSIIIGVVVTLLITSTILYVNFDRIAMKQVYRSDMNTLMQTSREVSNMTQTAYNLSTQIYSDTLISPLLLYSEPEIYDVVPAIKQLDNYRLSLPLIIESIYVYNATSKEVFITSKEISNKRQLLSDMDDKGIAVILNNFHDHLPFTPIPRTYEEKSINSSTLDQVTAYTYLCYNVLNEELDYAVVVNINDAWFNNDMKLPSETVSGQTFILSQDGILFSPNRQSAMLTDYSDKQYIKKILAHPTSSSFFEQEIEGMKSLVTYTAPDSLGWRYVKITPYESITYEIKDMRMKTIYIGLSILIAGIAASIFMSRKVSSPIHSIMNRMTALESERRNNLYSLRQNTLRDIFLGRVTFSPEILQHKFNYYGSGLQVAHPTLLVLFKIDGFAHFLDKYNDDMKLYKYAIMNIGSELAAPFYNAEAIDLGDDSVLLVLSPTNSEQQVVPQHLEEMLTSMQTSIMDHLKFTVSVTISPLAESVDLSIRLLKQVIEASMHRLFRGHRSIIYAQEIMSFKTKEYDYPVHKEKQLVESIMTCKTEEAKKIYAEIIQETAEFPYTVVSLAISHLTLTVNRVINTIKKNNGLETLQDFDAVILSLSHVETIEEINESFYQVIEMINHKLDDKRNSKYNVMVKRINDIIERDYGNPGLCLNSIADEMDMSPIYISRLYKQLTLNGLTDVIQEIRMTKAKHILLSTDDSIADIAEKTGFTNSSYFYRMFKKINGVTPNDYRRGIDKQVLS
jgi:two-component system response regulator YesN